MNYTKLFKQILPYSSENMISSHLETTLKLQPWIRVRWKGWVGYVQGGKQGRTKLTPKSTVLIQVQKLLQVQRGKIHTSNTWAAAFLLSTGSFTDPTTRGEAILALCPVCPHLHRPHWFPACSRQDPKPAEPLSLPISAFIFQFQETSDLLTLVIHSNIRHFLSGKPTFISTDWTSLISNCP